MFSIFLALQISTTLEVELRFSSSLRMICFVATGSAQKTLYFTVIASPSGPISIARPAFSLGEEGVGTLGAGGQGPRWGGRGDGGEDSLSVKGLLGLALWGGGQGHDREGEAHGVEGESRHP